jgi:hypothetical protein
MTIDNFLDESLIPRASNRKIFILSGGAVI